MPLVYRTDPSVERLVHSETSPMLNASISATAAVGAALPLRQQCGGLPPASRLGVFNDSFLDRRTHLPDPLPTLKSITG